MVPSVTATVPRTLEMPAWRTVKLASVWEASMAQVPAVRPVGSAVVVVVLMGCPPSC